jgi:hypothetical protein
VLVKIIGEWGKTWHQIKSKKNQEST